MMTETNPMSRREIDWKSRFKKTFKIRLVIIGVILGVAGCFLLGIMLLGRLGVEEFLQSTTLTWSFRILVIGTALICIWRDEWLTRAWQDRKFKISLYIFYGVGFIGWLMAIIDLLA